MPVCCRKVGVISLLVILIFFSFNLQAETKIYYRGAHFGKAWINVNGRLTKLKAGQTSKSGVTLLSFNDEEIVVKVDGARYRYSLGSSKGEAFEEKVILQRHQGNGGYWAKGRVNDKPVTFLVDTGASYISLSKDLAARLKLKRGNHILELFTASKKKEKVYQVTLDKVSIGGIEILNVPAIITRHSSPVVPLLGMSFLKHVEIYQSEDKLSLIYNRK